MGRLIEADALVSELEKYSDPTARDKNEYLFGMQQRLETCIELVEDAPTVDAVLVAHGHWIRHENADIVDGYLVPEFECSECHSWKKDDSDYCPDCGAKMEEDKVDDETK